MVETAQHAEGIADVAVGGAVVGDGGASGKKRKKGGNRLLSDAMWRALPSQDTLLGGDEGGFVSLEVLDDPEVMAALYPEHYGEGKGKAATKGVGKKKSPTGGDAQPVEEEIEGEEGGVGEVAELKKQMAALKAENKRLKMTEKREKRESGKADAKAAKRADKAQKQAERQAAEAAEAAEAEAATDVSAWRDFGLHARVLAAIAKLGFACPTPVQAESLLPATRDRRDIIGAAQTGSGKTLAFGMPIMHRLLMEAEDRGTVEEEGPAVGKFPASPLRALILAPTRELAMQVCAHLKVVGLSCGIGVVPIVGGIAPSKQARLLRKRPAVVVATPGRLWDLLKGGDRHLLDMRYLTFLVVDEADRMMQHGQFAELESLLEQIQASQREHVAHQDEQDVPMIPELEASQASGDQIASPLRPPQVFVFSATLTLPQDLRKRLRRGTGGAGGNTAHLEALMDKINFRGRPKVIDLTSASRIADKVHECYAETTDDERDAVLYYLLAAHPGRTIIFANAISSIRRLAALLKLLGLPVAPLHAGMQQRARLKALDRFTKGDSTILLATDVAARGLDVKDVKCVIHYQLPASVDIYVHRSGRTARADAEGVAICLVVPKEKGRFMALQSALNRDMPPEFPVDTRLMPQARERVRLAMRLDDLERRQKKAKTELDWATRTANELDIEVDSSGRGGDEDDEAMEERRGRKRKKIGGKVAEKATRPSAGKKGLLTDSEAQTAAQLSRELKALLGQPLLPKFNKSFFTGAGAAAAEAAAMPDAAPMDSALKLASARAEPAASSKAAGKAAKQAQAQKKKPTKTADIRAAAIQKALAARQAKKGGRKMVVIPQTFGRDASRPDALATLKRHIDTTG
mmetsp:Transcript_26649/g.67030  ORF Transcript_26649/g.67030 Transcript_26649/m.67030 type:complete len:863 (+) Transcript_26649:124-2712(+)